MQRARPWTPPSPSASQRAQRIQTSPRTCRQKPRPRRRSPGRCLPGAGSPPQRDARSCPAPRHPLHSSYGAHSGHRHGAFRPHASRGRRAQRCKRRRTSRAQWAVPHSESSRPTTTPCGLGGRWRGQQRQRRRGGERASRCVPPPRRRHAAARTAPIRAAERCGTGSDLL